MRSTLGQDTTTVDTSGNAPTAGGFWSQLPDLFASFEKARLVDAATAAQVKQIAQYGNINPAWIIAGVFVVLIAFARR